jgi:hypothetical protein
LSTRARAKQIGVLHRLVGAEESALLPDRAGAGRDRNLRRRGEVGAPHLRLESGALECIWACAALVDQDEPVADERGSEP